MRGVRIAHSSSFDWGKLDRAPTGRRAANSGRFVLLFIDAIPVSNSYSGDSCRDLRNANDAPDLRSQMLKFSGKSREKKMSPMRGTDYYRITGAIVATEGADRVYSPGEAAELRHASVEASSIAAVAKLFGRIGTGFCN